MRDGSDAIGDWPILNAMLNAVNGATWVSVHHGGGVGIGYSLHAGMVIVADGTEAAARRLERVLTGDPGMGVVRHADAGYPEAIACARERGVDLPMLAPRRPDVRSETAPPADRLAAARPRAGLARRGRDPAGRRPGGGAAAGGRLGGRRLSSSSPCSGCGLRPARERRIAGPILALAVASLTPGWAAGLLERPPATERIREHAAGVRRGLERPARRGPRGGRRRCGCRRRPQQARLNAFSRLSRLEIGEGKGRRALLLLDPDGVPVAWAGEGLLHELPQELPRAGPLLPGELQRRDPARARAARRRPPPLAGGRRRQLPHRRPAVPAVAGGALDAGRRPGPGGPRHRPGDASSGSPTLVVERSPAVRRRYGGSLPDRVAWAALGLALLAVAVLRLLRLLLPGGAPLLADDRPARLVSPLAAGGLIALGAALAVPPPLAARAAGGAGGRGAGAARPRLGRADRVPAWLHGRGAPSWRSCSPRLGAAAPLGAARPRGRHPGLHRGVRPAARPHRRRPSASSVSPAAAGAGRRAPPSDRVAWRRRRPAARRRRALRPPLPRRAAARRRGRAGRRLCRPAPAAGGARPDRPDPDGRLRRRRRLGDRLSPAAARVRRPRAAGPPVAAEAGGDRRRLRARSAGTSRRSTSSG